MSTPSQMSPQKIREVLVACRTREDVILIFRDNTKVTGGIVYNELKGFGRIIDVEHEISRDFTIQEIAQAFPARKPAPPE